jgi:hypothetical protein
MLKAVDLAPDPGIPRPYSQQFLEFWVNYPRRVGKWAAWLEWQRQAKRVGGQDALLELCKQRILEWEIPSEYGFIPHPRTWLHQGRFEDEDQ